MRHEIRDDGAEVWTTDDGAFHREDGPAVIYPDGEQIWWVFGQQIPFNIVAFFKDMGVEGEDDDTKIAVLKMKMAGHG